MNYLPLDLGIIRQDNRRYFACPKSSFHPRGSASPPQAKRPGSREKRPQSENQAELPGKRRTNRARSRMTT